MATPTPPPPTQSSLDIDPETFFARGLSQTANTETKRKFLCYVYTVHYEHTSWVHDVFGEAFQEYIENFVWDAFKDIDAQ